ncbi:MAG: MBL fold metallo-hydrolase [Actinomycetota bacterium]|nr:MBL fold metallo-hydrolase [Actinomycetota bacterium]MDQ6945609.1 MBL fold metallo-hydrolase [Actinomycetota bacterium]
MTDPMTSPSSSPDLSGLSRRALLGVGGLGGIAAVGALGTASPAAAAESPGRSASKGHRDWTGTSLVLLGTAGGPLLNTTGHRGISTAVVHDNRVYIVDLGHGSLEQIDAAGLAGEGASALVNVRSVLFTHLHSDHVTEWPAMYMVSPSNTNSGRLPQPIQVFGPGDRGTLPPVSPPNRSAPTPVNPSEPTPGIVRMTTYLRSAFASDLNDRIRDSNLVDPDSVFAVHDIDISAYWHVDPQGIPPVLPVGTRIPVWVDGDVTITATLVNHHPTAPAFGFRFDTPQGSIVMSGDTAPSENLIDLAQGADYLVHEVIDPAWVDDLVAGLPPASQGPVRAHLLNAHTTIDQVGQVAEAAHAKTLVLTHLGPADLSPSRLGPIRRAFSGEVILGRDLLQLRLDKHGRH